ncbi:excinuclease ABC subunit C [Natronobacterium gregoryi]|uniref:UvrABC system protein C n=2 Tax=Natronobacterium gregoryi TaxID=44930 RepID=L0AHJ0_NATGS|nr:excinuclease ABC subunit C [Natronobacterium gregoryi]AFZ72914.1 excinuclease ABC, C subunit [Natronobacterium gregoryi SP2]ELY69790.1 excinuclease ABC subunit C [Natronobacterium gregoryi SP2]PLK21858.1 excinuclease ABC subunit UvrC [Natronobacterium gregoryi SP2]SFI67130.1 Excinuclease ABC subunit C [Natronobacterium gregoryi]
MNAEVVRERANELPRDPGVYQFQADDATLYVGKAVDLRNRVRSYADPRSARIDRMVDRADDLEIAVTDTETQALLLEANLIKRHQPRYNVRLKDDKSYPMVQVTDHEAPRIEITRDPDESATVFGPYTNKSQVETVVKALRETYGVRGCSDHKYENRDRPCLDYEMGLCTAPCTREIDLESYAEDVTAVERFLEGETGVLADPLCREMESAAQDKHFERAANRRDRLETVEVFHGEGGEAVQSVGDERAVDVLGVAIEGTDATVARLRAEDGKLVERERHTLEAPTADGAGDESGGVPAVLAAFVVQYYAERELPDALLLPERHGDEEVTAWLEAEGVSVRVPGAGREAKLVELALKNARHNVSGRDECAMLADALDLETGRVERIEGFDVSHAQGKAAVGSDVTFVDGSAEKADYRRKKLTDENDDYANMRALLEWRARRAVEGRDDRPDPDLLLIDGGEGQLEAAREALAEVGWDVPAVALAKAEERVVTPDREYSWPSDAPHLHLLQRVRDEAHRFAVQYHQTIRDDVKTVLDDVPGIGPETRKRLLGRFGSVESVREASLEDLQSVSGVGEKTARTVKERL